MSDLTKTEATTLADIQTSEVANVEPDTLVGEALDLMARRRISSLVVCENTRPVGIFTERDMVKTLATGVFRQSQPISELMTPSPVTAPSDMDYREAYRLLAERNIRHLIVVDVGGALSGIVTESDILQHLGLEYFVEFREVSEIMVREIVALAPEDRVTDAIQLMNEQSISCVVVMAEKRPVGILTERDAVQWHNQVNEIVGLQLHSVMSQPVSTVSVETTIQEAARIMQEQAIRRLVVAHADGTTAGLLTQHDIVKGIRGQYEEFLKEIITNQATKISAIRKRLNERLALDNLLQTASDMAIVATDPSFSIIYCNALAERFLGNESSQLIGQSLQELLIRERVDPDNMREWIDRVRTRGECQFDRLLVQEGEKRYIQSQIVGLWDEANELSGYVYLSKDVTEEKKVEQHLHLFRRLIDQSNDAIFIADPTSGRFLDVNATSSDWLGYTAEQLLEMTMEEVGLHISRDISWGDFIAKLKRDGTGLYETEFQSKDGRLFPVEINTRYFVADDKDYLIGAAREISERKQAEAEREKFLQRMSRVSKMEAVGQLTGGIAHDFNNILASILGYSDLALELFGSYGDGKLAEYLQQVKLSGERARDLIQQMQVFSRGGDTLAALPLDPRSCIHDVVKMLHSTLPSSMNIQTDIGLNLPKILIDPVQLYQIIMNLCINARDAMDQKGVIRIRLGLSRVGDEVCTICSHSVQGEWVEIAVEDAGSGITSEVMERMFDPFYTTKPIGEGTGMGLSVVQGIVQSYQGHLLVESEPGLGTTFRLLFPPEVADTQELGQNASIEPLPEGRGEHILVLDDEMVLVRYLKELLETHGYRVTAYSDSQQALDALRAAPGSFDLVIADQTMPGITGVELAEAMQFITPAPPIILCTGFSDDVDQERARSIGIDSFFTKPVEGGVLLKAVAALL